MNPHERKRYIIITLLLVFTTFILTHMWTQDRTSIELEAIKNNHQYYPKPQHYRKPYRKPKRSRKPKLVGKVNINTASFVELCSIPQIGKVRAQGIIKGRPYYSINDVLKAKGIGYKTFNKFKDYITVGEGVPLVEVISPSIAKPPRGSLKDIFSVYCLEVFDGDTIVVRDASSSYRKVRLTGIDTPEIKHGKKKAQPGAYTAKSFTKSCCLGKTVYLDIDDEKPKDKYRRTLALVYLNQEAARKGEYYSLNAMLLRGGHAKIFYLPPTEFNPYGWK